MKQTSWWLIAAGVSTVLMAVLVMLWVEMNQYRLDPDESAGDIASLSVQDNVSVQLTDAEMASDYLSLKWESKLDQMSPLSEPTTFIKTGIFIQSLQFFNSSEVNLTGYIWQKYDDNNLVLMPEPGDVGFILPEQVNSGSDIVPREVYRQKIESPAGAEELGETLIIWYFEATLRQPFDYLTYPFDHKTVWVRMWPRDFSKNVVLTPDFVAYSGTGPMDIFGIEEDIVMGTWERQNTFFNYHLSNYDTNFGIPDYIGQAGFPELYYNFVIKRKFENAFVVYLLPLFLVSALLFAAMLTVSNSKDLTARHGFSTSGFIGASSALFFVVMLAHIQLREQFAGNSIVYIEYFYILMYAVLVIATANTYLFSTNTAPWLKFIHYHDNILPKIAYWPAVLTVLILITLRVMLKT